MTEREKRGGEEREERRGEERRGEGPVSDLCRIRGVYERGQHERLHTAVLPRPVGAVDLRPVR